MNADGVANISDQTYMIDWMFGTGSPPVPCNGPPAARAQPPPIPQLQDIKQVEPADASKREVRK